MTEEKRGEAWARERWEQLQPILFPEAWPETDRTLSGGFAVEAMLDPRWSQVPEGFLLSNAVVSTPLERRYACVEGEICFEACLFIEAVSVTYAEFKRRIRFLGCTFNGDLNLEASELSELWLSPSATGRPTLIHGGANFFALNIGERLICEKTQFLNEAREAYFNSIEVANHVSLNESLFRGGVNFIGAEIGGQLICNKTEFLSKEGIVYFNSAKVAHHALFREAIFEGPVDFISVKIGGQLYCEKAQFRSSDGAVDVGGAKVTDHLNFSGALFHGPVRLGAAEIGGQFICDQAQFLNEGAEAYFNSAKISRHASFRETIFHGPVNFVGAEIGGQLICEESQFLSPEGLAYFNGAKISHHVSFRGAVFHGPADFGGMDVGNQLLCERAQFLSSSKTASFNSAKIKEGAFFRGAFFHGPVDLVGISNGTSFYCEGAQFLHPQEVVNFDNMRVDGFASFQGAVFEGPVYLSHCAFSQNLLLEGVRFKGFLSFYNTTITGTLYLFSPSEIQGGASVFVTQLPAAADLRGLTYDRTDLGSEERWQKWIDLRREGGDYDPGPYLVLEQSFRRAGRDDLGDRVHFEMRRSEEQFLKRRKRAGKYILHCLWRWSVGYGVGGQRLFYLISAVFLSTYFFVRDADRQGLFQPGEKPDPNPFSPFWYTLDLLLPGVSLDYQEHWRATDGVISFFSRAVILVGWILVPLAVAQLAGLLKKKE